MSTTDSHYDTLEIEMIGVPADSEQIVLTVRADVCPDRHVVATGGARYVGLGFEGR